MKRVILILVVVLFLGCSYEAGVDYLSYEQYKTLNNDLEGKKLYKSDIDSMLPTHKYYKSSYSEYEVSNFITYTWRDSWDGRYYVNITITLEKDGTYNKMSYFSSFK